MSRPAVSSMAMLQPTAASARRVAGQAAGPPTRTRSARDTPSTKPSTTPTTGTTKNPTTPRAPPRNREDHGTPASRSRRPGNRYLAIVPATSSAVATARVVQARASCRSTAHSRTPAQTSASPGRNGTTTPARPISMISPASVVAVASLVAPTSTPCPRSGHLGSALVVGGATLGVRESVGLVLDVRLDGAQRGLVRAAVVCAEEKFTAAREDHPDIGAS